MYIILGGDCAISRDGHMLPYRVYMAAQCYLVSRGQTLSAVAIAQHAGKGLEVFSSVLV